MTKAQKSEHAQAAAMMKKHLQGMGLKASAKSDSFSMGNSVHITVLTPNLTPTRRAEIKTYCNRFQYGHFNSMEDIYEYSNKTSDLPQSKYVSVEFTQSDAMRETIKEYVAKIDGINEYERDRYEYMVWMGSWGDFWDTWAPEPPKPAAPASIGSAEVQKHHHTKRGFDFWLVVPGERLDRAGFEAARDAAQALGGWYSRKWGTTPGGYAFKDEETAIKFASDGITATPAEATAPRQDVADKMRGFAENMQGEIDNKLGDRQTNTPKRQREAQNARIDGRHLERTQSALLALADLFESGSVPDILHGLTTKKAIHDLTKSNVSHSGGYYDGGQDSGDPYHDTDQARAVWALLTPASEEERKAEKLRATIEGLQFSKIPGYFPTPSDIVAQMIDRADIQPGQCVLEPSAGSGALVEALPNTGLASCFEQNHTLSGILEGRGFNVIGSNFMESDLSQQFDRVLMNPPFEKLQDVDHVLRAYEHLRPGGRLVSIMSPSWTFNSTSKAQDFRDWFEKVGGESEALPAGAFKASGTGVASTMVVIDKLEESA